jgi:Fatty acid desaturase
MLHFCAVKSNETGAVIVQGATLDLVGASSFMWRQQHVAGHHVWTNVHDKDPDIRVSDADVRRVTPFQPVHPYQVRCIAECWGYTPV